MPTIIKGMDGVLSNLRNIEKTAPDEFGNALYQEAQIEATESQRRTPVDVGTLKGSHEVSKPEWSGRDISVSIKVGGAAAPYAAAVHYDREAFHKVGQALFLESTILESKAFMLSRIAKRINLNRLL